MVLDIGQFYVNIVSLYTEIKSEYSILLGNRFCDFPIHAICCFLTFLKESPSEDTVLKNSETKHLFNCLLSN